MVDDPDALLHRRRSSLLDQWAAGKRLTEAELQEIADLLPRAPEPAPILKLEAQVEGKSEKKYQRSRAEYAELVGESPRTINRWMKRGAPLDEPARLAAWWAENMKHRVPEKLLELATSTASPPVPAAGSPAFVAPDQPQLSQLEQARTLLDATFAELRSAQQVTPHDPGRVALAQRAYKDASEQLRRVELADPKIRLAAGSVVEKEQVRSVLTSIHTSLASAIRSFCKRVRRELIGKTATEQEAIWQEETDRLFSNFRSCEFADPV